jgi:plastocyanin
MLVKSALVAFCLVALTGCGSTETPAGSDAATPPTDAATTTDAIAFAGCLDATTDETKRHVTMGAAFDPSCIVVRAGQNVVWVGDTSKHSPTDGDDFSGPFAVTVSTDGEVHVTFSQAGTYPYYDEFAPTVRGEVRVLPK